MDFNFRIDSGKGPVSDHFLKLGQDTFSQAALWVQHLPYRRNTDKADPLILFREQCGTCSSKHALLRLLAAEQKHSEVLLYLGIFQMNGNNTPRVGAILEQHQLSFIPEAHNYLRIAGVIHDYTRPGASAAGFEPDLLEELIIEPSQIGDFKVAYHQAFIARWQPEAVPRYTAGALWHIREACIAALSG